MDQVSRRSAMSLSAASLLAATTGVVKVAAAETSSSASPAPVAAMDPRQALVEAAKAGSPETAGLIDSVLPQLKVVNADLITGQRSGAKPGQWIRRREVSDQTAVISPVSGSTVSEVAGFCSALADVRRLPTDCSRR